MQPPPRLDLGNPPPKQPQSGGAMSPPPPHFPPPPYREEVQPRTPKRGLARILPSIVTISAFGGLALLAWFAYQEGKHPVVVEELPVIKAEEESYKRAPENPGGEEIPHTDKEVYNSFTNDKPLEDTKKAAIIPDAEQPIDRAFLKQFGASGDEETIENEVKQESVEFGQKAAQALAAASETAEAVKTTTEEVLEPKPLPLAKADEALPTPNTGGVKPEQDVVQPFVAEEKPAQALADAAEKMVAAEAETTEEAALPPIPKEVVKKAEMVKKPETERKTEKKTVAAKKTEEKKKIPAALPKKQAKPVSGIRVQLGAFRSEAEAEKEWKRMQSKYKSSLGKLSMMVQKVDIPNKGTMYRLQAGPVASSDAARALCKKLVAAGQGCFVAK